MSADENPRPLTEFERRNQYRVGLSFNPSGSNDVDTTKRFTAFLMAILDEATEPEDDPIQIAEFRRCKALALTNYEQACMWAVKALTKPPFPQQESDE